MNREGKSYRSERLDDKNKSKINGSIVLVTLSEKWSPHLTDEQSNFTHVCLVLECPKDPTQVGREVRLDERKLLADGTAVSSWSVVDGYAEI